MAKGSQIALVLFLIACRGTTGEVTEVKSKLTVDGPTENPVDTSRAEVVTSLTFAGGNAIIHKCSEDEVSQGQRSVTASVCKAGEVTLSIRDFHKRLVKAYLGRVGRQQLSTTEKKIAEMAMGFMVRAGTGEGDGVDFFKLDASDKKIMDQLEKIFSKDLIRKIGYRGVVDFILQEIAATIPAAMSINDETQLAQNEMSLQDGGLQLSHEFFVPFSAQAMSSVYVLPQAYDITRVEATLSHHRGYLCDAQVVALNVWRIGESQGGTLRHMGNGIFESHFTQGARQIDRVQVIMRQTLYNHAYCKLEIKGIGPQRPGGGVTTQRPRFPRDTVSSFRWVSHDCTQDMGCAEFGAPGDYGCEAQKVDWSAGGGISERVGSWEGNNNDCELLKLKIQMCERDVDLYTHRDWQVECFHKEFGTDLPDGAVADGGETVLTDRFSSCDETYACPAIASLNDLGCVATGPRDLKFAAFGGSNNSCDAVVAHRKVCTANGDRASRFKLQCYKRGE